MNVSFNNANVGGFGSNLIGGDGIGWVGGGNVAGVGSGGPNGLDNAGREVDDLAFPQSDASSVMSGQGGVDSLRYALADSNEKADAYGMETTAGLHKVAQKSMEGVKLQFLKLVKADEKIAELERAISALPEGAQRKRLADGLVQLRRLRDEIERSAESMTGILAGKANAIEKGVLDLKTETEEQREKRLRGEIGNMRESLRYFRCDFDRYVKVKGWFLRRLDNFQNFFSPSRNRFFGYFSNTEQKYMRKESWEAFSHSKDSFDAAFRTLAGQLPADAAIKADFGETTVDDIATYMDSVADMFEAKTEDSITAMCIKSVKDQLRSIAENGGYKLMELELGVGFGIHITDNAEATVGGKGKYLYKVFSTGDGSVTIEHVGQGGADAHAKVRVGDILQAEGKADLLGGGGKSFRYRDLDSAARSVFTLNGKESKFFTHGAARFNPLFVKGRGILMNLAFGVRYLGSLLSVLSPLSLIGRGIDFMHKARTGEHLFAMYDPDRQHSDLGYFKSLKARGVFKAADRLLVPRKNILTTGKRSFMRVSTEGSAGVKLHVGPSHFRSDNSLGGYKDVMAKKENYRTYMTYLTNEQNGECLWRVQSLIERKTSIFPMEVKKPGLMAGEVRGGSLEDDIIAVLRSDAPEDAGGDKAVAKRILDLLQAVIDAEEEYGMRFEGLPDDEKDYEKSARNYRAAMLTAAALMEKFEALDLGADKGLRDSYEELRETAMSHFENPAVLFPEGVFRDKFFTQHTTADGKVVTKREHVFEYDLLGDLKGKMLGDTGMHYSAEKMSAGDHIGKLAGRAAGLAGVESVSMTAGLQGSVGVAVTEEVPTDTDGKAPWLCQTKKTYDIQFSANAPFDHILRSYVSTLCREANVPMPEDGNWKEVLKHATVAAGVSAFKRFVWDVWAQVQGKSPDDVLALENENFVNGGKASDPGAWFSGLDFWRDGHTIQLEYLDGRLSAISIGKGEKLSARLGLQAGPVVIHGGYKFESHENKYSYWTNPSFDALLDKCDSYQSQGNRTMWKMFAQRNQVGFARMADVYARKIGDKGGVDDSAIADDPYAKDDDVRIGRMRGEIGDFIGSAQFKTLPEQLQGRLRRNYEQLLRAEEELLSVCAPDHAGLKTKAEIMRAKMLAMRTVLELTVRHFDILRAKESLSVEVLRAL